MTTIATIDELAKSFAIEHGLLEDQVVELERLVAELRMRFLPGIKAAASSAARAKDQLSAALEDAADLFATTPRTIVMHGIKVGYGKQRGKVVIDNESATIARMRKLLPDEQSALMITVRESVHKPSVYDLVASDLKRLGIRIEEDTDKIIIAVVDSEVDKLVAALLNEYTEVPA